MFWGCPAMTFSWNHIQLHASLRVNKEIPMPDKTLNDLFLAQLKDIYYAEKKIYRTLPKMVKAAQEPELKKAFATHREETQGQI